MTDVSTGHTTGWLVGLVAAARLRLPDLAVQLLGHDRRLNRSHDRAARQACGGAWRRGRGSERKDVVDRSVSAMDLMLGGEGSRERDCNLMIHDVWHLQVMIGFCRSCTRVHHAAFSRPTLEIMTQLIERFTVKN